MWKLRSQYSRGTSLKCANNIMRLFFGSRFYKQVNVIRLNSKTENYPTVFLSHFFADFTKALGNITNQHLLATFGYPNKVIVHLIYRMIRTSKIIFLHVDNILHIDKQGKRALSSKC